MKTLLFVAADPRECAEWIKLWDQSRHVDFSVHWSRQGLRAGSSVIAVANGAGSQRAYDAVYAVLRNSPVDAVFSIGFCGALDEALQVGDVVRVTEVRGPAGVSATVSDNAKPVVCESVDHIVATAQEKRTLRNTGASVVEMEAAGVAKAAAELKIPFYCVRAVSDLASETFQNDFAAALLPDGRFSVAKLIWGALGSPAIRFAELVRLGRRTSMASKNLGEALANYSF